MWSEKIKRAPETPWQRLEGEALVLQPKKGQAHELNETAAWFWARFDGEKELAALAEDFFEEYDCDVDVARMDILSAVTEMKNLGIVE